MLRLSKLGIVSISNDCSKPPIYLLDDNCKLIGFSTQSQAGNEYLMTQKKLEFHDQVELRNFNSAGEKETGTPYLIHGDQHHLTSCI
jgi:hypothetical protein